MAQALKKINTDQDTLALLERVRLTGPKLVEARAQLLKAEAMAGFLYGAATLTMRVLSAIARNAASMANAFAKSAMQSGERGRDAYLAQATDAAELEQRIRFWQARGYVFRGAGLRGK